MEIRDHYDNIISPDALVGVLSTVVAKKVDTDTYNGMCIDMYTHHGYAYIKMTAQESVMLDLPAVILVDGKTPTRRYIRA